MQFTVIGEGRPAKAVIEMLMTTPGARVNQLVLKTASGNPTGEFAIGHGIPVVEKCNLTPKAITCRGGWLINVNSTLVVPAEVLAIFEGRSLNCHPGLLPEYAGLHTHQWAIRNGEREFGVTVHRMERRIDAGCIVGQVKFPIKPDDTGLSLFRRCLTTGTELLSQIIRQILNCELLAEIPQDLSRRRLYRHADALDGRIAWNQTAATIVNFVRAGNYEPFASPSYVARLDSVGDFEIELLRAVPEPGSNAHPGTILEISDSGPLIMCGSGTAVRIVRARCQGQLMLPRDWREYASLVPENRLQGRCG
jgi:methionyl-tRNA formyltransferase